jgi:FixJ family two-component response regulator
MTNVEAKRVFLVASSNAPLGDEIEKTLRLNIADATIFRAGDGMEASFKAENSVPNVAILDFSLPRMSAVDLTARLIRKKEPVAIVIMAPTHDGNLFLDEVVTGQVQFLAGMGDLRLFLGHVNRALNWAGRDEKSIYQIRFMAAGELLIREGEEGEFVYIVKHGRLMAFKGAAPSESVLGYVEPGEFVGEMAYVNGERRSASVICLEETELIEIPRQNLDSILFSKPAWSKALMRTLSRRLQRSNAEKAGKA